jgi:predicted AAA+ superfamily ATPase
MKIINQKEYEKYLLDNEVDKNWRERDFVNQVEKYMDSNLNKVLIISGLRGTGKSVGVLQAMCGRDAVYIIMEKGINTSAASLMDTLCMIKEKIIIIDEYTWISDRKNSELDALLFTLVNHGKRIIITGTESLCLEAMKTGSLIHRAVTIHTTHMSFPEYCRIYNVFMNQDNCDKYLTQGGIFESYVVNNEQTMTDYIETAVIDNLKSYVENYRPLFDKNKISNIIYTLFYRAIWDLMKNAPHLLHGSENIETQVILERLGIDLEGISISIHDIRIVADLLCNIGVLVKIPNLFDEMSDNKTEIFKGYKTYIVNPSLTCQFIRTVFPSYDNLKSIIGYVYEANCMVDLYFNKQESDAIYYLESKNADNYEIDIVISSGDDTLKKQFYLFECKHRHKVNVYNENWSILNGKVDDALKQAFPDSEISGRYIIHPGDIGVQKHISGKDVCIVNQDENLYQYYKFDEYIQSGVQLKPEQGSNAYIHKHRSL